MPVQGSLAGRVFSTGHPLRVTHPDDAQLPSVAFGELDVGPVLAVALLGSQRTHGVLSMARVRGRPAFTADELDMASSFANQAAADPRSALTFHHSSPQLNPRRHERLSK